MIVNRLLMTQDEMYMLRCLELAANGLGNVAPNPMVGSVVVHNGIILGEGFHAVFGGPHAEVVAIRSVKDTSLLPESTLYVNLEPCVHSGKTPPCANLIIEKKIPKVVIGTADPYHEVAGKGIEKLRANGVEVIVNVLEKDCLELNKRFFTFHQLGRPYIILKWAQTLDGFMGREENSKEDGWITNPQSKRLSHKWRTEEQSIIIGTKTALRDNPQLTARLYDGKDPLRLLLDKNGKVPENHHLFDDTTSTLVFTNKARRDTEQTKYVSIDFTKQPLQQILNELAERNIQSLIIEGGKKLLDAFIEENLWDEARIFIGNKTFTAGISAPEIDLGKGAGSNINDDRLFILKNND